MWLEDRLNGKQNGLVEKSRDMGATWMGIVWITYHWLFTEGFSAHLGSRKEDYVDKTGDPNTLFERIRFVLKKLPKWMMPKGFNWRKNSSHMRIINPTNNAVCTGESANDNFGRQARATVCWLDEFAFWEHDDASWQSVSQVSDCIIVVSTVKGKDNEFARLRWKSKIDVKTLNWRDHPKKDQAWYDGLKKSGEMTLRQIASEIDIDYSASAGRPFYAEFEQHMVIESYKFNPDKPLIRGWDFSYHHPACCFMQQDDRGFLYEIGEVQGNDLDIFDFMLVIKYVSHNILDSEQEDRVRYLCEQSKIENVLNIAHLTRFNGNSFQDFCDSAGNQKSDKSKLTSIQILNSGGIHPQFKQARIDEGANAFRRLMLKGMYKIHERCIISIEGFQGGYHYSETQPDKAEKDNYYDHLKDCERYVVQQLYKYLLEDKSLKGTSTYDKMIENGVPRDFVEMIRESKRDTRLDENMDDPYSVNIRR